jgi:hypothetical protein
MKNLVIAIAFLPTLVFAKPQVFSVTNPVDGTTSVGVKNNFIPAKGPHFAELQLSPMKLPLRNGPAEYVLSVTYGSYKWLFIQGSLVLNVDGKVLEFKPSPIGNSRDVAPGGSTVSEMAPYSVTRADLERVASASRVVVQVSGSNGVFFLTLKPENIAVFREFLAKTK